jgi:hypothetical protein
MGMSLIIDPTKEPHSNLPFSIRMTSRARRELKLCTFKDIAVVSNIARQHECTG